VCTRDALFSGKLQLWQPSRGEGYRFNLDPVLLSAFVSRGTHAVDLGSGCGVLGLSLVVRGRAARVTAVERQPILAACAVRNAHANNLPLTVVVADLCAWPPQPADLVLFNPPYFRAAEGRASPLPGRDAARHECGVTLADFVAAAAACTPRAICAIVPATRERELGELCSAAGYGCHRVRRIRPRLERPPVRVMLEACRDGAAAQESDLCIHDRRAYSDEVAHILQLS
jgi:tRNA1Val (adenine37-N6)-methyltransferase